ncbi:MULTISPECIES: alpha/beta fold hydrolase [Pseudoalteromonas]|uniref:Alpha/beta hydrolase n=2 Tax=Pseudoalteromonas distincta TaxID=77608 RepID=A0ABT9GBA0_9GAMM|nr:MULTISPECIES: alpha/beta hydrolase [Pseudoalteromonas]KAA1160514.1 alpha/beta hydrolase [Pseudoalteromonas distincta]MBE3673740.1 hypothetical protein [Pseudoalteromonas distincta KMM 3548]MBH0067999.1 alpha/beta hydrolase [Pseudoalteromonas sp. NZS100]MDC3212554.1 alpha/beta hydrolase [Pseudoalteromonas distincta]MDP4483153.1 alpha/beta hydrolase [Pseudoalteromonas elyakovii]
MTYLIIFLLLGFTVLFYLTYSPDISAIVIKKRWSYDNSKFVNIDKISVHYIDEGKKDAPVLIMLHGLSASLHTWHDVTKTLTKDFRVISLDLPGFGITGPWEESKKYDSKNYSKFVEKFINKLEIFSYTLVGNSFGGEISWQLAKNHRNKINALILINATPRLAPFKNWLIGWKLAYLPITKQLSLYFLPYFVTKNSLRRVFKNKDIPFSKFQQYSELTLRVGNRAALISLLKSYSFDPLLFAGDKLNIPTLVVWGEEDEVVPFDYTKEFILNSTNTQLEIVSNAGHLPHEELPIETSKLIKIFLKPLID